MSPVVELAAVRQPGLLAVVAELLQRARCSADVCAFSCERCVTSPSGTLCGGKGLVMAGEIGDGR